MSYQKNFDILIGNDYLGQLFSEKIQVAVTVPLNLS